jgi:MarR family transcriptional regulator, organic hydroperoxide resistance regulator
MAQAARGVAVEDFDVPERGLGHLMREAGRIFSAAMQQRLAPYGITLSQWLHMRALWDNKGISQSALSKYLGVEKASSTAVLNYLDERRLIRRVRNKDDGRITNLELTAAGEALVRRLIPRAVELNATARAGLPRADVMTFIQVARAMIRNLDMAMSRDAG